MSKRVNRAQTGEFVVGLYLDKAAGKFIVW